jgi:hypothetical protein
VLVTMTHHPTEAARPAEQPVCVVCLHRVPDRGGVCETDRDSTTELLDDLPRQLAALEIQLIPTARGARERVAASRTGSPTGARIDALSLVGPGAARLTDASLERIPMERRWRTNQTATVHTPAGPVEEDVVVWHRAAVRGPDGKQLHETVEHDDQVGSLPPSVWILGWAARWQHWYDHSTPRRRRKHEALLGVAYLDKTDHERLPLDAALRAARGIPLTGVGWQAVGYVDLVTRYTRKQWQDAIVSAALGLDHRLGGPGPLHGLAGRSDPLRGDWSTRFTRPTPVETAVEANLRYLATWFEQVCDDTTPMPAEDAEDLLEQRRDLRREQYRLSTRVARMAGVVDPAGGTPVVGDNSGLDVASFVVELRALHRELARVLGEHREDLWIGRCPAIIVDRHGGGEERCGAGLWQDPFKAVYGRAGLPDGFRVECPRCHTGWGPDRAALLRLAVEVRRAWPVDRRRRYTSADRMHLPALECPTCWRPIMLEWVDVTGTDDTVRWWRAVSARCPNGCAEARTMI